MTDRPTAPQGGAAKDGQWTGAFRFIFAAAVINAVSFGIMIPVLPNLIKQFTGGDTAAASEWNVVFGAVWGVMQLFCGPVLGMMSDRFGRRPILLISLAGLAIDFLFMALAPSLAWLFVGRVINGLTAASFSTANAYVADVTPPDKRAKAFGWMGSAFSFGFLVGPALGGFLGDIDLRLPFFVAAGLTTINWFYGFFVLPESLPPEKRVAKFDWKRANPVGSLVFLRAHADLLGLATVGFLFQLAHTVLPAIFVLYTGYRYGWTPGFMGLTMMATGLAGVIVQTLLVGPVVAKIGERGALLLGAAAGATGFAIYGFAPSGWIYFLGVPVFALMNFLQPGLQGLMTRRVEPSGQGQLQGANQSLQGIASVIGPIVFGLTFAWSIRHEGIMHQPGLAIYLAAGLLVGAFLLALRVGRAPRAVAEAA
ncbi:MAG: TCR/Tet family MFS transporter [Pseudomonadota bacterium]|uniref:TCR/Tet family MFS transporter n=1 Tax=Phenylobacterium sp. TaxID=1871053 RepID=UPI0025DBAA90|nr:TCR/Tet family MFS transporter [Phenylobacterium sp.]MBT9470900.1 TCR/Tet family MFS transporter [Phenylobacterium sp.]